MMRRGRINLGRTRRGFSLIEVVTMVLLLAIAVPPTMDIMVNSSASRVNVINTARATMLANNVLEGILADVASGDETLGFEALADSDAYLNTPTTGLVDRMRSSTQTFTTLGLDYSVDISALHSSDGLVSGDEADNVFRTITVRVSYPSADGAAYELPVSLMVAEL